MSTSTPVPTTELDISAITIGTRVRRDFSHVPALAENIREFGLIQPVVLDHNNTLIAGESRIRAFKLLNRTSIPVVYRGCLSEAELTILEASENNIRKDLTWQERCLSVDKVHRLRNTAAIVNGTSWGVRETGALLGQSKSDIGNCTLVASYLHSNDKEIWSAATMTDAMKVLINRRLTEATAKAAKETITAPIVPTKYVGKPKPTVPDLSDDEFFSGAPSTGQGFALNIHTPEAPSTEPVPDSVPLSSILHHADSVTHLRTLPDASFDHCITDWPYGIDMEMLNANNIHGGLKGLSTVVNEHDVKENESLHAAIIPEIFRVLTPKGFFITWTDAMQWQRGYDLAIAAGFSVQRWPLIWLKTSQCMNQTAQYNFTKNYEIAMVCRKQGSTLLAPQQSSVWTGGNDAEAKALGHPFAKPFALWDWLYSAVCVRGDRVLEPFAGRGSAVIPAIKRGLRPYAIECQKEHHDALTLNIANTYRSLLNNPNLVFT